MAEEDLILNLYVFKCTVLISCIFLFVGCVNENEGETVWDPGQESDHVNESISEVEQPIICGPENWNDMRSFDDSSNYRIGAQYGKAVGWTGSTNILCNGVLYDSHWLLTANHCGDDIEPYPSGRFDFGEFWGSENYARGRLRDLGLSASQANQVPEDAMKQFDCVRYESYNEPGDNGRDVAAWGCQPNFISGLGWVGPGDIWGHVELAPGMRSEGTDVYVVARNKASFYSNSRLLLSPGGEVTDSDDGCVTFIDYEHCFELNSDTLGGSSGAPIFDQETNRVFGLVHGNYNPYDSNDCPFHASNYGSYLPSTNTLPGNPLAPNTLPSSSSKFSNYVGSSGGNTSLMLCPDNFLAAGVVGTTYPFGTTSHNNVGNFGIVCVPHLNIADSGQYFREMESWVVLVGGSYDTELGAGMFPFNEYIHENLDLYNDNGTPSSFANQQQSLTMCDPGKYLKGVTITRDQYVGEVVSIQCITPDHFVSRSRFPRVPIGNKGTSVESTQCPSIDGSTKTAAHGLYIKSGWLTDGFMLVCRKSS